MENKKCPKCDSELKETDLETEKMRWICSNCAPEFVKYKAFDDYDGSYSPYE